MSDGEESELGTIEIDIPSRTDLVTVVRMIVASAVSATGSLSGDRLDDLRWVTSEAITNAIEANERAGGDGRVRAICVVGPGWVRLTVTDQGPGMPGLPEVPDMEDPDRLLIEGGFGVPLMNRLAAGDVTFDSTPSGTTVELRLHQ